MFTNKSLYNLTLVKVSDVNTNIKYYVAWTILKKFLGRTTNIEFVYTLLHVKMCIHVFTLFMKLDYNHLINVSSDA